MQIMTSHSTLKLDSQPSRQEASGRKKRKFHKTLKKPQQERQTKKIRRDEDKATDSSEIYGVVDSSLLADTIVRHMKKFESDLSPIELEDRYISAKHIADTTSWSKTRSKENIPEFLQHFASEFHPDLALTSAREECGSPHTIIVTGAGIRAADLSRCLRVYQSKDCVIAKLFAKHIKLSEAVSLAKSKRIGIAVGTPQRILDLMREDALLLTAVKMIVIDKSYTDQKQRNILDMKETFGPLLTFLNEKILKDRFDQQGSNGVSLLFY